MTHARTLSTPPTPTHGVRYITGTTKAGVPDEHLNRAEVKRLITQDIKNPHTRALACVLYLTGCRISEIVGRSIPITQSYTYKGVTKEYMMKIVPGLKKSQLVRESEDGRETWKFRDLAVLKRRAKIHRDIYVSPEDDDLVDVINEYATRKQAGDLLFGFGRKHAWYLMNRAFGKDSSGTLKRPLWNHFWRHQCATSKVKEEGFDALALVNFMEWGNMQHAQRYVSMSKKDIKDIMWANYRKRRGGAS